MSSSLAVVCLTALGVLAGASPGSAVLPLFVGGGPSGAALYEPFAAACQRAGLPAPEQADVAGPAAPRAAQALASAAAFCDQLRFDEAIRALDLAAEDAAVTGGAGLNDSELADVFLLRAWALRKSGRAGDPRAWDDFIRAATLASDRVLDGGRFPPGLLKEWKRAVKEVQGRPRGTLVVRAPLEARISIDGRAQTRAPAVAPGLPFGQHHVRVEEPGRLPWGTVISLAAPTLELDVPPRAALALDDAAAAARGRRAGARFVLVAQPRPGVDEALLSLALIDVATETRRDQLVVDAAGPGALEVAVRRVAGGALPTAPPPAVLVPPTKREEQRPWLTRPTTWIAVGAVLAAVATALVISQRDPSAPVGFSSAVDPSRLGR